MSDDQEIMLTFNQMVDVIFDKWFSKYQETQSTNLDLFKPVLKKAFIEGWFHCEKFYEVEN